jgi:hypothetical protein
MRQALKTATAIPRLAAANDNPRLRLVAFDGGNHISTITYPGLGWLVTYVRDASGYRNSGDTEFRGHNT